MQPSVLKDLCVLKNERMRSCRLLGRLVEFCYQHDEKRDGVGEKLDDLRPFLREVEVLSYRLAQRIPQVASFTARAKCV
jgi:hypothetical protein